MNLPSRFTGWLTINRACNLRCEWCYAKIMSFSKSENMTLDTARQSIRFFKELPLENVILIGGEPTIHPHFLEIVKMIREADLQPLLVTNSIKIADNNFLQAMLDAGLVGITTSLKAANEKQYQQFTGRRVFSKVMEAIDNINKSGVDHKISVTICESLFKNFNEVIGAIVKGGTQLFSLDMGRPVIVNNRIQADGIATPREMASFIVGIYPELINCGVKFNIKFSIPFCLFPENFVKKLIKNNHLTSGCQIFNGDGVILDPGGRLLPCNHFCDNALGQLGIDFTTAEEYYQFRKRSDVAGFYKTVSSCPHRQCIDCQYWQYCGSGCKIHWLHRGTNELIGNFKERR